MNTLSFRTEAGEERFKVSVIPEKKLRWTVKTSTTTTDLDTSFPLSLNQFYHFTVVYTGFSMEIYADGALDTYTAATGTMATTSKVMTFGKKDINEPSYTLKGTIDEVRIYDKVLAPAEIATLKTIFQPVVIAGLSESDRKLVVYPNPSGGTVNIAGLAERVTNIDVVDMIGKTVNSSFTASSTDIQLNIDHTAHGMMIVRIQTSKETFYRKIIVE